MVVERRASICAVSVAVLQALGCALPDVHRESGTDSSLAEGDGADDHSDARPDYDPMWDPANRNEDFATFESLVPPAHRFAEWPMSDSFPEAKVKPSFRRLTPS